MPSWEDGAGGLQAQGLPGKPGGILSQDFRKGVVTNGSVVEHLPAMCEALGSSPSITQKKKKKDSNTNATGEGKDGETSPKAPGLPDR